MTVVGRVVTVLMQPALVVEDLMAVAMIVLTRLRTGERVRVGGDPQRIVRRGDRVRERHQGLREHEQRNQPPRQRAGDLLREEGGGAKDGHVGSGSGKRGAFRAMRAGLYRSPAR